MAIRAIFDSLMKNPNFGSQAFSSRSLFFDSFVGASSSVAATSFAIATPFAYRALFGNGSMHIAYCDAGAIVGEDFDASVQTGQVGSSYFGATLGKDLTESIRNRKLFENDELGNSVKQYNIQMKPLLSAFHWKNFALTSLRSFLLFYLPLLEPHAHMEDEGDDFLVDKSEEHPVDLVEPFKKSVKQIIRETTVVTTRRILERFAVHYASQRMAWKLLKDVPESAIRKAGRGMPTCTFCFRVSKTTFRGHLLGVVASWAVQVGLNIYGFFFKITKSMKEGDDATDATEEAVILGKKVYGATVRCVGSLVFASIVAGMGATLIRPSTGQRFGCVLGDLAGAFIIEFCFKKLHWELL